MVDKEITREILTEKINPTPLRQLINSIKKGKTTIRIIKAEQYTPIAQHIINQASKIDAAVQGGIPTTTILQLLKKRIEEREVTLLCLNCGWHTTMKVKYIPEQVKCPRCRMRQIAVLKYGENPAKTYEITRKARRNQRLTREEQEKWQELTQTAWQSYNTAKKHNSPSSTRSRTNNSNQESPTKGKDRTRALPTNTRGRTTIPKNKTLLERITHPRLNNKTNPTNTPAKQPRKTRGKNL